MSWGILRWLGFAPVPLSAATEERLNVLFPGPERGRAKEMLLRLPGLPKVSKNPDELDRIRFALLRLSNGSINELEEWIYELGSDYRTVLLESGFCHDVHAHESWFPKGPGLEGLPPIAERARAIIDVRRLGEDRERGHREDR
jgi:hypothetical protein